MLNASVGAQRVLARLRPARIDRAATSVRFHRRSVRAAQALRVRAVSLAAGAPPAPRASVPPTPAAGVRPAAPAPERLGRIVPRVAPEASLPIVVALIVALASIASWLPGLPARGAVGGPDGDDAGPRLIAVGPEVLDGVRRPARPLQDSAAPAASPSTRSSRDDAAVHLRRLDPEAAAVRGAEPSATPTGDGQFLADGTLLKPIAVTTTVADGKDLLRTYKVAQGDSLVSIADKYGVSMMTVWWASGLKSKDDLKVGQTLVIPPVNGLVVTVREGDTLDALASKHKVSADTIYETNGLEDRTLVPGQTLILPGAEGPPMPTPTPRPTKPPTKSRPNTGSSTGARYTGGGFAWPVVGGGNYISQYFHAGHRGIDIAADHGSTVRAAAGGTVIFAGWKNNGGGYQVHLSHGSGLYTTYNHMSGVSVGVGQRVGRGQQVGRIGATGYATGPHLHFDVWKGKIWDGGVRVNPLAYY